MNAAQGSFILMLILVTPDVVPLRSCLVQWMQVLQFLLLIDRPTLLSPLVRILLL